MIILVLILIIATIQGYHNFFLCLCPLNQVGHGTYADVDSAGVSCTGTGETFVRAVVARRVAENVESGASASLGRSHFSTGRDAAIFNSFGFFSCGEAKQL